MRKIVDNSAVQHTAFWIASFLVLLRIFAEYEMFNKTDIIYTFLFHLSLVVGVYVNLRWLIPSFLNRRKWYLYILGIIPVLLLSVLLNEFIFNVLTDWIFPGYYFISYYSFFTIMQFVGVYLVVTTLIKLSKSWFSLQDANKKLIKLESLQSKTELKALKAQINPHFLFNNLHSIYSLALENHPKTPMIILKLSDVLRFMLYDTEGDDILLKKELDCIEDYLILQKIRLPQDVDISFQREGTNGDIKIAPLLLMPLVENSFKHGILSKNEGNFVRIHSKIENRQFFFKIENSRFDQPEREKKDAGIGIVNLKRRLALLYPERHSIQFEDTKSRFNAILTIQLA